MLVSGVRRWALPTALVGLLTLVPAVAALGPSPGTVTGRIGEAAATAQSDAAHVLDKASTALDRLPSAPEAPPAPQPPQDPQVPDAQATADATVAKVETATTQLVGVDVVNLALETARHAKEQVDDTLPGLTGLGASNSDGQVSDTPAPQGAAAVPVGSLLVAGSILVVGAAVAGATYVVLWLAGSSSTLGAGAATPELRRLLPFASPLFTRFERDTVLGHPRREQLYAKILQEPGISLQDLGEATGLSRTAVVHHLRLLEQQHLVVSRRVGRSRHYYENGGRYGHDQKEAYAILRNDRSKAVADFIKAHPGTMQKSLCEALSIPPSIAHWHVRRLTEGGLVQSIRQGRAVAYFPGASLATVSAGASGLGAVAVAAPPMG